MNATHQNLDIFINWEPYTFDGTNTPSTGVLCKWQSGQIDYFDPRKHPVKCLSRIVAIEAD